MCLTEGSYACVLSWNTLLFCQYLNMRAKPSVDEAARKQIVYFLIIAETWILALCFLQHYFLQITVPAAFSCCLCILSVVETMQPCALFLF